MSSAPSRSARWARLVAPAIGIVVFLALWEGFVRWRDIRPFILTAPSDIVRYLNRAPRDFFDASIVTVPVDAEAFCVKVAPA
mgnify:CR=1 FL=1